MQWKNYRERRAERVVRAMEVTIRKAHGVRPFIVAFWAMVSRNSLVLFTPDVSACVWSRRGQPLNLEIPLLIFSKILLIARGSRQGRC